MSQEEAPEYTPLLSLALAQRLGCALSLAYATLEEAEALCLATQQMQALSRAFPHPGYAWRVRHVVLAGTWTVVLAVGKAAGEQRRDVRCAPGGLA